MFLKRPPTGRIGICWVEGDCGRTKGSEMDDMGGLVLVVQRLRLGGVSEVLMGPMHSTIYTGHTPKISLRRTEEDPLLVRLLPKARPLGLRLDNVPDTLANEARAAGDEDD